MRGREELRLRHRLRRQTLHLLLRWITRNSPLEGRMMNDDERITYRMMNDDERITYITSLQRVIAL